MPKSYQQSLVSVTIASPPERAVAYVRVSTERQQYSMYNQMTAIEAYASAHQLHIVQTYSRTPLRRTAYQRRRAQPEPRGCGLVDAEILEGAS